ncbi:MAG: hypothetical protein KTR18_17055 [Acidiferrobacterales bacterium]|nr:hypothetical protein [Acidiferrobacterales bacterium]
MSGIVEIFLSPLQGLLNTLQNERHHQNANTDRALIAIKEALISTKRYIELSGEDRDRGTEFDIAMMWNRAAIKARRANMDFADVFDEKAKYWEDKEVWEADKVAAKGIKFSDIEKQLDDLIKRS